MPPTQMMTDLDWRMLADTPDERIGGIEQQRRLAGDVRRAGDGRDDLVALLPVFAAENAADDALLHPLVAGRQLAVGREARELGAGARAAGRPVVGLAGTEDEVPAVHAGFLAGPEELDVVNVGETGIRDGLPDARAVVGELRDVGELERLVVMLDQAEPVAAPGEVDVHVADAGQVERQVLLLAVARDI